MGPFLFMANTYDSYRLSDFKLIQKLGQGGFGSAFLAEHRSNGTLVCLKAINLGRRIVQEAAILSRLKHQNIIEYYGSFAEGDKFFIIMEYSRLTL